MSSDLEKQQAPQTLEGLPTLQPFPTGNPEHPVRVRFHETESGLKCLFRGRLDAVAALEIESDLKPHLEAIAASPKRIVYDLTEVDYVASAFLRLCVMAVKASKGEFAILNPKLEVRKVLRLAGLESLVKSA